MGEIAEKNRPRRSPRIPGFDYARAGAYFVTICTRGRRRLFGEISGDGVMQLSSAGKMVSDQWQRLSRRFPFISLDEFVVMPDHLHGIILIGCRGTGDNSQNNGPESNPRAPTAERFGAPTAGSIPTIVRSFKSSTTLRYHFLVGRSTEPLWQRNYYEHIIRGEEDLNRARQYVLNNPLQWSIDQETPEPVRTPIL